MEDIIHSLQNLQLSTKQEGGGLTALARTHDRYSCDIRMPISSANIANICLQLYHENVALKKEIQRLHRLGNIQDPQIPNWVR